MTEYDESQDGRGPSPLPDRLARLGENWGWVMTAGIAYIILGIVAFNWPISTTVGLTFGLGVLFIAAGVIQLIHAIQLRHEADNGWRLVQAVIALAAGVLMLRYPDAGMMGVAIAMTFYFFVSAAAKGFVAMALRPLRGSGWALASAIASFLLGVYIIATLPYSALWVPGFILGVDLVVYGVSLIGLSADLKSVHRRVRGTYTRDGRATAH